MFSIHYTPCPAPNLISQSLVCILALLFMKVLLTFKKYYFLIEMTCKNPGVGGRHITHHKLYLLFWYHRIQSLY